MNNIFKESRAFDYNRHSYSHKSITGSILNDLQKRGFLYLFRVDDECIYGEGWNIGFEEFDILEVHSMETTSSDGNCILYAIKCDKLNIKGVVINQPDIYANNFFNKCISKLLNYEQLKFRHHKADCVSEPEAKDDI